mmetsp:Transcript_1819/g.3970  ORF Transcript_1819/g.3970 Transcript_1819/m.3970 type:complete len:352 (-) Transcript_1819:177-1232(-)
MATEIPLHEVNASPQPFVSLGVNPRNRGKWAKVALATAAAIGVVYVAVDATIPRNDPIPVERSFTDWYWPWDPRADCSEDQDAAGCHTCFKNNTCACVPAHEQQGSSCRKVVDRQPISFYMYRAQNDENYEVTNANAGTLEGVMWYLHNEVVRISCPRHYNISRVLRLKVTMMPTEALFKERHGFFGPFVAFDMAKCTVPHCEDIWKKYGYVVGCQRQADKRYGKRVSWYSLPGACPSQQFNNKSDECVREEPGGKCPSGHNVTGEADCTWTVESAGEISVSELEGVQDYDAFCREKKREFDVEEDQGDGLHFWDGMSDDTKNAQRVKAARALFIQKYPQMPELHDPFCDW